MARYGFMTVLLVLALAWPAHGEPATDAFDWSLFSKVDGEGWTCLKRRLDDGLLAELAVGGVPEGAERRSIAVAAYGDCSCNSRPPPFAGVLFDALARFASDEDAAPSLEEAMAEGVGKVALPEQRAGDLEREFPDLVIGVDETRFVSLGDYGAPEVLRTALAADSRINVMVSGRERGLLGRCGVVAPAWASLFESYPERFLFASAADRAGAGGLAYRETVAAVRRLLGQLPSVAAAAVAHGNAEVLYGVVTIGP